MTAPKPFSIADACPGIRGAVQRCWDNGHVTTDSGDGSYFAAGMGGALPVPMIVVLIHRNDLINNAHSLMKLFPGADAAERIRARGEPSASVAAHRPRCVSMHCNCPDCPGTRRLGVK